MTIAAANTGTLDLDSPAAQDQRTRDVPGPHRLPLLLMRIASSAQRRALRLQFLLHEPES